MRSRLTRNCGQHIDRQRPRRQSAHVVRRRALGSHETIMHGCMRRLRQAGHQCRGRRHLRAARRADVVRHLAKGARKEPWPGVRIGSDLGLRPALLDVHVVRVQAARAALIVLAAEVGVLERVPPGIQCGLSMSTPHHDSWRHRGPRLILQYRPSGMFPNMIHNSRSR